MIIGNVDLDEIILDTIGEVGEQNVKLTKAIHSNYAGIIVVLSCTFTNRRDLS